LFQYQKFKGDLIVSKMFDIETSACAIQGWKFTGAHCVAQGWKFNILVAQCYTCMIKQEG
jgi:hypothetical protein